MPTETEELQAKEFLKRAEIRTMRKDLQKLREADSLKERDKIVQIKTLDEQLEIQEKKRQEEMQKQEAEKGQREQVLQKNAVKEREAEKNIKEYATEQERQQIFILESQRLGLEKQVKEIEEKKDPALKLEKNNLLIEKKKVENKLAEIEGQEKKQQDEEAFVGQKAKETTMQQERKTLEQRKWEIEDAVKETEKKRWEVENKIKAIDNKVAEIDKSSDALVAEKNALLQKIMGMDKSLREIYSVVIAREEQKKAGKLEEQRSAREAFAKTRAEEKETIQRQQWGHIPQPKRNDLSKLIPAPVRQKPKMQRAFEAEEKQRQQFVSEVENWAQKKGAVPPPPKKNIQSNV